MARSPWRRIPLASIAGELTVLRTRLGLAKTSADLTPATGARTTRFCRTQLPSPTHPTSHWRPAEVLAEAFSAVVYTLSIAHGKPPCEHACAPNAAASTAPHPNVS